MGGIYAVRTCGGGGEYGRELAMMPDASHEANVFDNDFHRGAPIYSITVYFAIELAIGGGSNGGLLVGAA